MGLCPRTIWGIVEKSRLWEFVEGMIVYHEFSDAFDNFYDLYLDISDAYITGPYTNDCDCFKYTRTRNSSM